MKTIGTIINTIVVVFGMLCSLIAGAFVGYSMAMDNKTSYPSRRAYTSYGYTNTGYYRGYNKGWKDCEENYQNEKEEEETEVNENIGEA